MSYTQVKLVKQVAVELITKQRAAAIERVMNDFRANVPANLRRELEPHLGSDNGAVMLRLPKHKVIQILHRNGRDGDLVYRVFIDRWAGMLGTKIFGTVGEALAMADKQTSRVLGRSTTGRWVRLKWCLSFAFGGSE